VEGKGLVGYHLRRMPTSLYHPRKRGLSYNTTSEISGLFGFFENTSSEILITPTTKIIFSFHCVNLIDNSPSFPSTITFSAFSFHALEKESFDVAEATDSGVAEATAIDSGVAEATNRQKS
jgi:hypothetical protein